MAELRRVELPPGTPPWDGRHTSSVRGKPSGLVARGVCSCGWLGPVRRGRDRRWQATADCDEHVNGS